MTSRFQSFGNTPLGQQIASLIDTGDRQRRQIELNAFSREGFPAVTALVTALRPVLLPLKAADPAMFNAAKQFVGWHVGEMMRGAGYRIANPAKAVPGKLFTVGAVWEPV